MFRLLKVLTFALALAALSIFVASCSSNGSSQIRFVHAIQDRAQSTSTSTEPASLPSFLFAEFCPTNRAIPACPR